MVVFLDVNSQMILLYKDSGLIRIPFSEAADIYEYIGDKTVKYVTEATTANANDIIGLINSLGIRTASPAQVSKNKYIHTTDDGTIRLGETLKFEGKFDCKLIDIDLKNELVSNHIAKKLINTGKLEIIGEVEKRKLDKEYKKVLAKKVQIQEQSDERLNNIIVDGRVDDLIRDGRINIMDDDHGEVIEIDLKSGGKIDAGGGVTVETMSELLDRMSGK